MSLTLVLNRNWMPINVVSWRKALKKVINRRAEIVYINNGTYENYDFASWASFSKELISSNKLTEGDEIIHNKEFNIVAPSVIRSLYYSDVKGIRVRLTRKNLYLRDNYTCGYCGKKFKFNELNIDHIIPRSKGGSNTWENVTTSCVKCNTKKNDMLLEDCGMVLCNKIYIPFHSLLHNRTERCDNRLRNWGPFLKSSAYEFEGEIK